MAGQSLTVFLRTFKFVYQILQFRAQIKAVFVTEVQKEGTKVFSLQSIWTKCLGIKARRKEIKSLI